MSHAMSHTQVVPAQAGLQFASRSRAGGSPVHKSFPRRRESSAQVVPAQAGIQWSARDDWVPAYAGMTDKWEAHS